MNEEGPKFVNGTASNGVLLKQSRTRIEIHVFVNPAICFYNFSLIFSLLCVLKVFYLAQKQQQFWEFGATGCLCKSGPNIW